MRLFLALLLPEVGKDALERAAGLLRDHARRGTFPSRESRHLTLAFLGDVPPSGLKRIQRAAQEAVREVPAFSLTISGAGRFRGREGDTWWAGTAPSPALEALAERLRAALQKEGFSPDTKPFRAHLTLARRIQAPDFAPARLTVEPFSFPVERLSLMSSELHPQGATYREIFSVPLPPLV